ncbi:MAG: 4-hydroxy-tetrahydrodipicolinate synthase [Clostridia bacterium]|nr:4-hydroxy-tetrahydrodipicolinate synthase [Clostridia bacterium]
MKKKTVFRGIATAMITPFKDGRVDFDAYGRFIDWQIESGVNALVACGTTGESSTLSDNEHRAAIAYAVQRAAGRVPVIAGTGSNELDYAVDLSKFAVSAGVDAILVVTPYYNKATQKGLVKMYTTIADEAKIPTILYNEPSRTGNNLEPKTYAELAEHPNIVAFKEANGNISKIVETMSYVRGKLDLYSGNDDQIVPLMARGGIGAISVLSNILPKETVAICDRFFAGDVAGAAELQCRYHALIDALFSEVNPIPVKAAVAAMGFTENTLRLPLTELEEGHKETLFALMRKEGIDV